MNKVTGIALNQTNLFFTRTKNQISGNLTPLHKRIFLVAAAIFTSFILLYFAWNDCFSNKTVKSEAEMILPKGGGDKSIDSKSLLQRLEKKREDAEKQQAKGKVNEEENIGIEPKLNSERLEKNQIDAENQQAKERVKEEENNRIDPKSIAGRLEKNRKYAESQQAAERVKGFEIEKDDFSEKITIFISLLQAVERDIHGEKHEVNGRGVGIASCQGMRPTMEDAEIAANQSFKVKDTEHSFEVFGVFDGHGGDKASAYVKANIQQYLKNALEDQNPETLTDEGIFKALKACCQKLDADYDGADGTTATITVILNGKIWVANVGDSRTILVKGNKVVQASEDAKPGMDRYKKTIEKLGGCVINYFGIDRVNGNLAVARAIGDKNIIGDDGKTCCISPNPKITCYSLDDFKGGYLVLACDGLYDVASTNEVGKAISKMEKAGDSVENMGKQLVYQAITNGSKDNVTAMVVKL